MACPYFYPVAPQMEGGGAATAMMPLGGLWTGTCRALPGAPWQPGDAILRPLCNLGYARENCRRFPPGDGPDAVRFTVLAAGPASLRLYYVAERDHHPFAHGPLEYSPALGSLVEPPENENLARQAAAYAESYLCRAEWGGPGA